MVGLPLGGLLDSVLVDLDDPLPDDFDSFSFGLCHFVHHDHLQHVNQACRGVRVLKITRDTNKLGYGVGVSA